MQRRNRVIRNRAASDINRFQDHPLGPLTLGPDDLRNETQKALSALSEADRESLRDELLTRLREAGVNLASALMLLGIPARTPDDLSPSDMGMLLRYVRINTPEEIKALAKPLARLLSRDANWQHLDGCYFAGALLSRGSPPAALMSDMKQKREQGLGIRSDIKYEPGFANITKRLC